MFMQGQQLHFLSLPPPLQHYDAIKRYITNGPMLVEVSMNSPHRMTRSFMDSLLAFWPGLQVHTHTHTHTYTHALTKGNHQLPFRGRNLCPIYLQLFDKGTTRWQTEINNCFSCRRFLFCLNISEPLQNGLTQKSTSQRPSVYCSLQYTFLYILYLPNLHV